MLKGSNQILNDEGRRRQSDGWRVKLWGIAVGMNKKEPKFHDMERSFYSAEELQSDHTSNHVTHGVDTTWKRFRAKRYKRRTLHSAAKSPINSGLLQFQYVKVERRLWVRSRKSPELQLPAVHILSVSQRLAFFLPKISWFSRWQRPPLTFSVWHRWYDRLILLEKPRNVVVLINKDKNPIQTKVNPIWVSKQHRVVRI